MKNSTIAIIGGGNMGSSLLGGLIKQGQPPQQLWVTDTSQSRLDELQQQYGVHVTTENSEVIQTANVIILAVKPQMIAEVLKPLAEQIQAHQPLIISIAAGIRSTSIEAWLGGNLAVVRCMPNTPALIGLGASGLYANEHVTKAQCELAEAILDAVGSTAWVQTESDLDAVTALSGSGPAYVFLVIEAMQSAGEALGLKPDLAKAFAIETVLGAAEMAKGSPFSAAELRKQVTSPGGTTEKAISVLESYDIRDIFKEAMAAARQRSEELANILGGNPA